MNSWDDSRLVTAFLLILAAMAFVGAMRIPESASHERITATAHSIDTPLGQQINAQLTELHEAAEHGGNISLNNVNRLEITLRENGLLTISIERLFEKTRRAIGTPEAKLWTDELVDLVREMLILRPAYI